MTTEAGTRYNGLTVDTSLEQENPQKLEEALAFSFDDPLLLCQALTHSSYVNENPEGTPGSNERLELLGDAVLGLVIVEELFREFPQLPEGGLTRLRSQLVRGKTLAMAAARLGLGGYLRMGVGERNAGGHLNERNLAGAFEALLGAIYLDQGLTPASGVVLRLLEEELKEIKERGLPADYKSLLQQRVQSQGISAPVYRTISAQGPAHRLAFAVEVVVGSQVLGQGSGSSKRAAEQEAARQALERGFQGVSP